MVFQIFIFNEFNVYVIYGLFNVLVLCLRIFCQEFGHCADLNQDLQIIHELNLG